jgi:hypothetical protein
MTSVQERRPQVSVPIDAKTHAAIERVAQAEERTVAGQIRHWISRGLAAQRQEERAA